jgi:YbgC/YbaW family acyl-CoA thioester hydrolase
MRDVASPCPRREAADLSSMSAASTPPAMPGTPRGPGAPAVEAPVAETEITVRSSELDSFGHVNHAVFLHYFEHARFEALEAAGFSWSLLEERGWGIYVVRIEVDYLAEARRGDRLTVRTHADSFRRTSMVLAQTMERAGPDGSPTRVAQARVTAVWIGPDRKPMRVPDDVRAGLSGHRDS